MNARRQGKAVRVWLPLGALAAGLVLLSITISLGIGEGIASDAEHRAGVLPWPVILGFLVGIALTAIALIRLLAAFARSRTR
ncbi:hypothetical protein C3E77_05350 [Mycetocola zhujimingii]|nr:hypothetical protein C3E77_05350 [Mycetocola zhujimingii]